MSNLNKKMSNELLVALEQGTLEQVRNVIVTLNTDELNYPNKKGQTALQIAVRNGDEELVRMLVSYGCEIDRGNYVSGQTALFLACWNHKPSMVNLLIQLQANLNVQDNRGWTALMISSYNGLADVVHLLLSMGADHRIEDSFGKKPIDRAKDPKIISMLNEINQEYQQSQRQSQQMTYPGVRGRNPQNTDNDTQDIKNKRNLSLNDSQKPSQGGSVKYTGIKEVENASHLRQLASQLVSSSEAILQASINDYLEIALERQVAQFQQNLWNNILSKFEDRHYVTFSCLTEYLALKLKVGMAHLGIKVPDDLLIDYQQKGASEFQTGFSQMVASETLKLNTQVQQLNGRQVQESANLEEKIYQIAQSVGDEDSAIVQHMQQSFQITCQRLFEVATDKLSVQLQQQCPLLEKQIEQQMQVIIERTEKEMKKKVEDMVQRCVEEVKVRVNEVDGWITRKDRSERHSIDKSSIQASPKFSSNKGNLQQVFQKQNSALKEKINLLKSTLSPKHNQ